MNEIVNRDVSVSDMVYFDRRLNEIIYHKKRKAIKWRVILTASTLLAAYGGWFWLTDPTIRNVSFGRSSLVPVFESLGNHSIFCFALSLLFFLFVFLRIHHRIVGSSIVASRCRKILTQYCLDCNDEGKLIIQPTA
uniref:Transmembrane protein 188 n=1 Tax=Strongyloides papillosus TaxID=174720 RepID=A0A0N5CEP5_STREA